jgi:cytochrome c-type biogenesis protein CcmE
MRSLDDELAAAVEDNGTAATARDALPPATDSPAAGSGGSRPKRNLGLLIALMVVIGGILTLVFTSFEGAAIYSKGVDELLAERSKLASRNVRVEGSLVKGSLQRRDQPCEYRFRITKNGSEVPVRFAQCVVPDTFRDVPGMDVDVTAEGKLSSEGHFEATNIMAKCPSKYEMKQRASKGEAAPHGATMPAGAKTESQSGS